MSLYFGYEDKNEVTEDKIEATEKDIKTIKTEVDKKLPLFGGQIGWRY